MKKIDLIKILMLISFLISGVTILRVYQSGLEKDKFQKRNVASEKEVEFTTNQL